MVGRVFLTGGTGSIGRALLHRAERDHWNVQFTVYSRDESKQSALKAQYPQHRYVLGDVREYDWLRLQMRRHDLVVHAAAYKQVPMAEVNASEAVETNVVGSRNVARAAVDAGIERVVGISTDKAVMPVNLYGATKMAMERLFQEADTWSDTRFTLVRYGNVIGSTGSVVPFFRNQAITDGCITITDRRMTRFWLSIGQAVDMIVVASKADRGCVVVRKCPTMLVVDILKALYLDLLPMREIGLRPGEKLHECLLHKYESRLTPGLTTEGYWILNPVTQYDHEFEFTSDENDLWLSIEQFRTLEQ